MRGSPQSIDSAGLVEGIPGKVFILFDLGCRQKKRPRYGPGLCFWFYFYCSWSIKTNTPTSKGKMIVCYVDATELSTDVGA